MVTVTCGMGLRRELSGLVRREQRADRCNEVIESLPHLTVDSLQGAHPSGRRVEFGGKPGPIGPERLQLSGQAHFTLGCLPPAFNRSRKGFQRKRKSPAGCFDGVWVDHGGKYMMISSVLRRRNRSSYQAVIGRPLRYFVVQRQRC
jgi:hypothetical protein